jgi:hypothetical protein
MWVRLLKPWNGHEIGEILKVGYHTFRRLLDEGIAEQSEPPSGAAPYPPREKAVLPPREKR